MPREIIRPSHALAQMLRDRREACGLSVRDVSHRTEELGEQIPPSTITRIEQGKTDPGVRRLVQLLRIYEIPPEQAAELVEVAEAVPEAASKDPLLAFEEGMRLARLGDARSAMAHFLAARRHATAKSRNSLAYQKAMITMSLMAKDLGQARVARQILDDLFEAPLQETLRFSALLAASTVWMRIGSFEPAAAYLARAQAHIPDGAQGAGMRAMARHQEAKLQQLAGQYDRALDAATAASEEYGRAKDAMNAARVDLLRVDLLRQAGRSGVALALARRIRSQALKSGQGQAACLAAIREGQVLLAEDRLEEAGAALRAGLAESISTGNKSYQFLAHFHLWKLATAEGMPDLGKVEFDAAGYFLRFVDEQSPESLEMRRILDRGGDARDHRTHKPRKGPRRR